MKLNVKACHSSRHKREISAKVPYCVTWFISDSTKVRRLKRSERFSARSALAFPNQGSNPGRNMLSRILKAINDGADVFGSGSPEFDPTRSTTPSSPPSRRSLFQIASRVGMGFWDKMGTTPATKCDCVEIRSRGSDPFPDEGISLETRRT